MSFCCTGACCYFTALPDFTWFTRRRCFSHFHRLLAQVTKRRGVPAVSDWMEFRHRLLPEGVCTYQENESKIKSLVCAVDPITLSTMLLYCYTLFLLKGLSAGSPELTEAWAPCLNSTTETETPEPALWEPAEVPNKPQISHLCPTLTSLSHHLLSKGHRCGAACENLNRLNVNRTLKIRTFKHRT